jgi:hypothetical protein
MLSLPKTRMVGQNCDTARRAWNKFRSKRKLSPQAFREPIGHLAANTGLPGTTRWLPKEAVPHTDVRVLMEKVNSEVKALSRIKARQIWR